MSQFKCSIAVAVSFPSKKGSASQISQAGFRFSTSKSISEIYRNGSKFLFKIKTK